MKDIRVLFLGNSHTFFNDMPHLFAEIYALTAGHEAQASMLAYPGRTLAWHLNEYFSLRYALMYGKLDYCFIQQAAHPFPREEDTLAAGKEISRMCRDCGVTPVFSMTWAEKISPEAQPLMARVYRRLAQETGALLSPVGEIWQDVREKHPDIELYYRDGAHASPYGDLLIAATHVATLVGSECPLRMTDHVLDFDLQYADARSPAAKMDERSMRIPADPIKTESIRSLIVKHIS